VLAGPFVLPTARSRRLRTVPHATASLRIRSHAEKVLSSKLLKQFSNHHQMSQMRVRRHHRSNSTLIASANYMLGKWKLSCTEAIIGNVSSVSMGLRLEV
jgi:hypothetical protein